MTTTAYAAVGAGGVRPYRLTPHQIRWQVSSNSVMCECMGCIMAKVIEFYARDFFLTKVKSVRRGRRGKVIELPKDKPTVTGKTAKIRERHESDPIAVSWPGCF